MEKTLIVLGNFLSYEGVMGIGWSEEKGIFYPITILKENFTGENIQLGLCDPLNNYQPTRI